MELRDCRLGEIVTEKSGAFGALRIGHIVGLTITSVNEVIPIVRWAGKNHNDGYIHAIHHGNIELLK